MQILKQDRLFAGLHWFESVSSHFSAKKADLQGQDTSSKSGFSGLFGKLRGSSQQQSSSQSQNRDLAIARLDSYSSEFSLLSDVLSCAELLFSPKISG